MKILSSSTHSKPLWNTSWYFWKMSFYPYFLDPVDFHCIDKNLESYTHLEWFKLLGEPSLRNYSILFTKSCFMVCFWSLTAIVTENCQCMEKNNMKILQKFSFCVSRGGGGITAYKLRIMGWANDDRIFAISLTLTTLYMWNKWTLWNVLSKLRNQQSRKSYSL